MIRLAWRQFRTPAIVVFAVIVMVAAFAAVTGHNLAHAYAACKQSSDCDASFARSHAALEHAFGAVMIVVPALLGAFWGAPLVAREIEGGTFPLVWTQSVTRGRWLIVKLGVVGLAGALAMGLLSLIVTAWARPLDRAGADLYGTFSDRDLVPVGYALFAFALGVTVGMLVRHSVPAMAITLFVFLVVRIGTSFGFRPRVIPPMHQALALDPTSTGYGSAISPSIMLNSLFNGGPANSLEPATPNMPNAWIYSTRVVDGSGHDLTNAVLNADCPNVAGGGGGGGGGGVVVNGHVQAPQSAQNAMEACVNTVNKNYHELITYQPAGRYWPLQWCEFGLYAALALALAAFCLWWVRRRRVA